MKTLKFSEKVVGLPAIFKRQEVITIFEPYEANAIKTKQVLLKKLQRSKTCAFIVPVNPNDNYGREHKVYYLLETYEATFLNELSAINSITSAPLQRVNITDDEIIFTDEFYPNDYDTRKQLKAKGIITGRF